MTQPRGRPPATTYARRSAPYSFKQRRITVEGERIIQVDAASSVSLSPSPDTVSPTPKTASPAQDTASPSPSTTASPPARPKLSLGRRPRTKKKTTTTTTLTQLTLDLGQRILHTCRDCGMSYHPSCAIDARLHTRFHAHSQRGLQLSFSSAPIWRRSSDDAGIFCVTSSCSTHEKRRVREVLAVVDSELGAAAIPDEELWSGGRFKVFLYSAGARVVGCLLAERIEEAYVAVMQGARLGERRKAVLGICRVWTAREWRRGGIARRLVEIARERLVFGCKIPREEVAFSQPTESGAMLAEAWWRGTEEEDEKKGGEGKNGKGGEEGEGWLVYVERV